MKEDFEFLHKKLPELQTSSEVEDAVEKHTRLTGEKVPNDPNARLEVYMERLENVFLNKDERVRERNIELLRPAIHNAFVIKREDVPESYFELQQRIARERGQPVEEIPQNVREQMITVLIEDQKKSLDSWVDYLSSGDAVYPAWFKYFAFRNVAKLSQFDKERKEFKQRSKRTTAPFPDIYREALAQICDEYEKAAKGDQEMLKDAAFQEYIGKKFPTHYAEAIAKTLEHTFENKEEIKGEWVKYAQGDMRGAQKLYESLQGKGTGWCTAGESTARTQVERGDFYVYYTNDANGDPTQPRIAIRKEADHIVEVRGVHPHQELEPILGGVLEEKLKDFGPEADTFKKKSEDMKLLTEIENKIKKNEFLTKDELIFLYEINSLIEGFGYQKDPRIALLREGRNTEEDMLVIFECERDEIAHVPSEINENSKAYVGEWNPTIFQTIKQYQNIKHLYESFPDKKILMRTLETDPTANSPENAEESLKAKNIYLTSWGKDILYKTEFSTESKTYELVQFTVKQLGFPDGATTDEIYAKAIKLGLELAPAEVGPHLRLQYGGSDWKLIAMKQIPDRDGDPNVFHLDAGDEGLRLRADVTKPSRRCSADRQFVFCFRKKLEASES